MSRQAHATLASVDSFQKRVSAFSHNASLNFPTLLQLLEDALAEVQRKVEDYRKCIAKAQTLLSQARERKTAYANARAKADDELSRTPKTLPAQQNQNEEAKKEDRPNPQYARLEQESRLLASQYSTASATSEKVYRKFCALEHDLSYLESDRQKLEQCLEQAKRLCQEMEGLNERASSELDSIRDVIRDYLDVPLGR